MTREEAYRQTLEAIAKMQSSISEILGAKALEAEKVRSWILEHLKTSTLSSHTDRLMASMQIHEQHVAVIDGLAKLCGEMSHNMRVILHPDMNESAGPDDD